MQKKLKPVIYIVGPTASGKTALSVKLAERFCGEIIAADSMQIYKGMSIATAAPTAAEKGQVPHRLFEFLEPTQSYSVSQYVQDAKAEIAALHAAKKLPFVVGGTGLYIDSLAQNVNFGADTKTSIQIRSHLQQQAAKFGSAALYSRLQQCDPPAAEKIQPNDQKRVIRALEVFETTGQRFSERVAQSKAEGPLYRNLFIGTFFKDRQKLYDRINLRVNKMLEQGLLQEAAASLALSGNTACQAIGHKELYPALRGELAFSEAVEHLKQQTRRYAKRQLTWFGRNEEIHRIYMDEDANPVQTATKIIEEFLEEGEDAESEF